MTHYGFSQVPRLITRGKEIKGKKIDLSLIEKGLYTCLKDICGDEGECYYALRTLAEEINTSISTLSRYIPVLRDKGVINATKKVRGPAGNKHEIWHISIVSIWEENDTLYAPTSQDCFNEKQSSVSNRNNASNTPKTVAVRNKIDNLLDSVSNRNTSVSDGNKDCFYLNDRVITNNSNNLEEDKVITGSASNAVASVASATPSPLIENLYQSLGEIPSADPGGPITTQQDTPPGTPSTPAGSITVLEGGNAQSETPAHHNALQSVQHDEKQGSTECTVLVTPPIQDKPPVAQYRASESTSNTQGVDESNRQATEQGASDATGDHSSNGNHGAVVDSSQGDLSAMETAKQQVQPIKQASTVSPIAGVTTKNPPATNNAAPQKPRGGRGKGAVSKEEKPQLSEEEKAKEAQYTERRRFWQNKINERRGGPLRTRGLCINETECLNTLVREFDDIDIGKIDRHLATEHWKYKKNPAEIGGKALLDESRPTLQYLKTHGNQSSNGSSQQTPTPIKGSMTHDEACKLAQNAIEEAEQYNITITAQAFSSKNNPDIWGVRVKWDDGSKDGFPFPVIKVREQWDGTLTEIRKIIKEEAKQAARSVARMQEAK